VKIVLSTLPSEGQVKAYVTPKRYFNPDVRYMPLGLLSVASGIEGHEVVILDPASMGWSIPETVARIETERPDVLGISTITLRLWALARILKETSVRYKVVGGPHVVNYAEETLALGATAVIKGDGDFMLAQWLDGCPKGIFTGFVEDLSVLPRLDFSLLNIPDYILESQAVASSMFKESGLRWPVFTSKGCPYHCTFCENLERHYRMKPASRIALEMWEGVNQGAACVHAQDDMFHLKGAEISRCLIDGEFSLPWSARIRADTPLKTLELMAEAGCRRVHVGVEALDDSLLAWACKGFTEKRLEQFLSDCQACHLEVLAYLIMGIPGEMPAYRESLLPRLESLGVKYFYLNILYPFPNTRYYASLLESGVYETDYWRVFASHPELDWEIPLPRSKEEQLELEAFVEETK